MSRTIRKTHYRNGETNNAWLRCKIKKVASNKLKKSHTKKNCWSCW